MDKLLGYNLLAHSFLGLGTDTAFFPGLSSHLVFLVFNKGEKEQNYKVITNILQQFQAISFVISSPTIFGNS